MGSMLQWMGRTFARFVAFVTLILGGWIFTVNVSEARYTGWVLLWVLASGAIGVIGGVTYLLSLDGPKAVRRQRVRMSGWIAMLFAALLPTNLQLMILPMVIIVSPIWPYVRVEEPVTSE